MSHVPITPDLTRTSDFLFEVGSLMMTVFGVLFGGSIAALTLAFVAGYTTVFGIIMAVIFGLLALLGIGLLYYSLLFDQ
ncbi:hypothetical protein [Halorubrum sp. GN11GM_10-3_MGM]|uniref:hypothetical protein n=1 Tax=Halorubrum sp. GN11GM_10-3_MGM TaxID=2518111 RepID=UPI0010F943F2|nr:hypothetical protein [Halorubrum sp. GN11GM_10-3_MGM]TKX72455.1 hypothetical protein EXE40_04205 [Halorubrum sp. GN11GM_10-3_MGM]